MHDPIFTPMENFPGERMKLVNSCLNIKGQIDVEVGCIVCGSFCSYCTPPQLMNGDMIVCKI